MRFGLIASFVGSALAFTSMSVASQTAPISNVASPAIYKVLQENHASNASSLCGAGLEQTLLADPNPGSAQPQLLNQNKPLQRPGM